MSEAITVTNPDYRPPVIEAGDIIVVNGEEVVVEDVEHLSFLGIDPMSAQEEKKVHTNGRREDRRRYAYAPIDGKPVETVRHPRIRGCGHNFVVGHVPQHRNCKTCWNALFINDAQLSENIAKGIQEFGPEAVGKMIGKKILNHFLRFITMVAEMEKWKRDHEPQEEAKKLAEEQY